MIFFFNGKSMARRMLFSNGGFGVMKLFFFFIGFKKLQTTALAKNRNMRENFEKRSNDFIHYGSSYL